jgi:homogentisate 1,2-dioxygenase
MPITGKVHQPPPVHQVFEGYNFVVCNFCPRKVDYHEQSIPVPYYHSNVDSDEVMFYVGGDYEAPQGLGHQHRLDLDPPGGYAHGPQPSRSRPRSASSTSTSPPSWSTRFRPLELGEAAWPWRTRRTPGPGPAAVPTPTAGTRGQRRRSPQSSATAEVEPDPYPVLNLGQCLKRGERRIRRDESR